MTTVFLISTFIFNSGYFTTSSSDIPESIIQAQSRCTDQDEIKKKTTLTQSSGSRMGPVTAVARVAVRGDHQLEQLNTVCAAEEPNQIGKIWV